jgi:hypothetical protein
MSIVIGSMRQLVWLQRRMDSNDTAGRLRNSGRHFHGGGLP